MIQKVRDRLADAIVSAAMWAAERLYRTPQEEMERIHRELDELERQADEREAEEEKVKMTYVSLAPRERVCEPQAGDRVATAVIDGRILHVRIPGGTTWVSGGSC